MISWQHHNERDGVQNHRRLDCLLNRFSGTDQRKHQSSASLAFVGGIHRWPMNSPHKGPVTRKLFLLDDVIMIKSLVISRYTVLTLFAQNSFCLYRLAQEMWNIARIFPWNYQIFMGHELAEPQWQSNPRSQFHLYSGCFNHEITETMNF